MLVFLLILDLLLMAGCIVAAITLPDIKARWYLLCTRLIRIRHYVKIDTIKAEIEREKEAAEKRTQAVIDEMHRMAAAYDQ
jgi:hypothetical protein